MSFVVPLQTLKSIYIYTKIKLHVAEHLCGYQLTSKNSLSKMNSWTRLTRKGQSFNAKLPFLLDLELYLKP